MAVKILTLFIALILAGCGLQTTQPTIVKVPIAVPCPERHLPPKPQLPINDLTINSSTPELIKALLESLYLMERWADQIPAA